jgi:peptidoglycan-N-acetylglucosamine deacetylase
MIASFSLDLDNKWSYLKTHGDAQWQSFPSYFDLLVPRILDFFEQRKLQLTFFVVGQDASLEKNRDSIQQIAAAGHEIGNHSFHHNPWLHLLSNDAVASELKQAEEAIMDVTGVKPVGFRGPGFSCTPQVLGWLLESGYEYDGSTFPTYLGPVARAYFFLRSSLNRKQREERKQLFGSWKAGFQSLKPFAYQHQQQKLVEIPVTTMPLLKAPIHLSYVLYLAQYSRAIAKAYFSQSITMCRLAGIEPSLLFHPLDFLGGDEDSDLAFFPGMKLTSAQKIKVVEDVVEVMQKYYRIVTMREHAQKVIAQNHRVHPLDYAAPARCENVLATSGSVDFPANEVEQHSLVN